MRFIFSILFLLPVYFLTAQKSPFDKYGPLGTEVYKDLKKALKVSPAVYKMDLSYQPVEQKQFNKIGKLKNLQALQLSSNGLTQFPKNFSNLHSLTYFASINNNFSVFPKDLKGLQNLRYLELFGCKIDSIPDQVAALNNLKVLHIGNIDDTLRLSNQLKRMMTLEEIAFESVVLDSCPKQIFRVPLVKYISLSNARVQALPVMLDKTPELEVLILDYNQIREIPRSIYKCKKLIHLSLKNNRLTKIPDTICQLTKLTQIDLRGNRIPKDDIEELKALLPGCKILY
jgi:Leucine-rich repeat (LRR) protein